MNVDVSLLENSHVDEILKLRNYALSHLNNQDDYVVESDEREFVERHLGPSGVSFGYRVNGKLVGYSALTTEIYEYGDSEEIAPLISNCDQVWGALAATILSPESRGLGLQRKAIRLRKQFAKDCGITHLGVVVSTKNTASISNLFREGANLECVVQFGDGRVRYLLSVKTSKNRKYRPVINSVICPVASNKVINDLLCKAYVGRHMISFPNGKYIEFVKYGRYDD